jgi:CheY-like chemotaxis protein
MTRGKWVLVVDDDDDIRDVVQVSLETTVGWHILTARSGREGVAKARTEQPDAILLDVMMPEMDGVATYQELQADPSTRHIPVVFLTAKIQSADQRFFADLGVGAVIGKPFDPLELASQVAEKLGWAL